MDLFKNEVESVRLFKILNQLDDVLVTSTVVKSINFLEDSGSRVSRDLINNFDREFLIGPNIAAGPDRRVRALTQNLAGHLVQILKTGGDT